MEDPTTLLSAIQIGITLIAFVTGIYSGATLRRSRWRQLLDRPRRAAPQYTDDIAFGVVVLMVTFVSLIIGELVPKRVALMHAESLAISSRPSCACSPPSWRRSCGCCA